MTVADALAVARALAVIPIAYFLSTDQRGPALAVFVVAALSDALDGWVARRGRFAAHGELLDPLADKVLVLGTALLLVIAGRDGDVAVPPALFALLAVREVTAGTIRIASYRARTHRPATVVGKLKTTAEMCAIALLVVVRPPDPVGVAALALLWAAVLVGLASLVNNWPHRRRPAF